MKNKGLLIGGIVLLVVIVLGVSIFSTYNKIVDASENAMAKFSDIDTQLQRRADLIPNLVNTVKGYMKHEEEVIDSITSARENLVNASTFDEINKANDELTTAINNLYVVVENYPDLKASANFISLQDEIAGSENRVSTARKDYNDAAKDYNALIKKFPANIVASMFGYESARYFEASESSKNVPEVSF